VLPLTLLAPQKLLNLLVNGNALSQQISAFENSSQVNLPVISSGQIVLSSANPDIGDKDLQLAYPRISLYSAAVKNTQFEKFRSLSGAISVIAEIWASANLVNQTDQWIHYYVEAMTNILRQNIGDWGDGIFFAGVYDVQFHTPKVGGFGYVEAATLTCSLTVSRN
jgi:hypothetical protein